MHTKLMKQTLNSKHLKLSKTYHNNIKISDMNLKNKYTNFEDSRLDESKTLLYEIQTKPKRFKRYSRGSIVRVKFGVNIGSEFSGDHFAIVVSKKDTMYSPILHVIPITSKQHNKHLNIGTIIYNEEEIERLNIKLNSITDKKEQRKIKKCLRYYKKRKDKISYACIKHLKTISKLSIMKEINEYDYIKSIKCSEELMKRINNAIIIEYTL